MRPLDLELETWSHGVGVPGCKAGVDITAQQRTSPKVAQLIMSRK